MRVQEICQRACGVVDIIKYRPAERYAAMEM